MRVAKLGIWRTTLAALAGATLLGPLTAFASTGLTVTQEQFLFMPMQSKAFEVVEVLQLKNDSPLAEDVRVALPSGYQSLSVAGDKRASKQIVGANLVLSKWAKPQATTTVTLTYILTLDGQSGVQFSLASPYPVDTAHFYLPIGDSVLSAPGLLPDTRTETISGTTFRVFTRPGIAAGDTWPISLDVLPTPTALQSVAGLKEIGMDDQSAGNTWQALGNLLVAAGILTIGLLSIRSTQWGRGARKVVSPEESLYRAWESLEWQRGQGMIDEVQFEKRRGQFKRKLAELKLATLDRHKSGDGS
ncbi:MAG: hypothetical protein A2201_08350 [Alicyclobacillus sp. RIFOXYA1_FULL_53_8]|nr:MAG: hypothetical protein A2201_08350 [Alicyclobacillus sp. RIFOXYA1_FULL_53_8]